MPGDVNDIHHFFNRAGVREGSGRESQEKKSLLVPTL